MSGKNHILSLEVLFILFSDIFTLPSMCIDIILKKLI